MAPGEGGWSEMNFGGDVIVQNLFVIRDAEAMVRLFLYTFIYY